MWNSPLGVMPVATMWRWPRSATLCHHIAPMHGFTSNRNGSNKTSQGNIIDFVAGCFVDKNDGENDITTDFPDGLDGL